MRLVDDMQNTSNDKKAQMGGKLTPITITIWIKISPLQGLEIDATAGRTTENHQGTGRVIGDSNLRPFAT